MRRLLFLAVVALQLLFLAGLVGKRLYLLRSGESALLACEPVDPRSILSGDYVRLNFTISRFTKEKLDELNLFNERFEPHQQVFVALERPPGQPHHRAVAISRDRSRLRQRWPLLIRGEVRGAYPLSRGEGVALEVRYGVEEYFVPQGEGLRIETSLRQTVVEVAVASSGESAIRRLFIDGKEVRFY